MNGKLVAYVHYFISLISCSLMHPAPTQSPLLSALFVFSFPLGRAAAPNAPPPIPCRPRAITPSCRYVLSALTALSHYKNSLGFDKAS